MAILDYVSLQYSDVSIYHITIVYAAVIQLKIKENIKAPCHWPLGGEFIGDRGILRTKGQ